MNILTTLAQSTSQYVDEYYTTTTTTMTPEETAAGVTVGIVVIIISLIFAIGAYVIKALLLGRIFKKAGLAQWPAWVPVYNSWKMLQIGGQQGWLILLAFIPLVQIVAVVFMYIAMYNIGLKLQKSGAFVLLAIFLPLVWLIWLAVDSSKWDESLSNAPSLAEGPYPEDKGPAPTETPTPTPVV
jgi:hypothetical protein